MTIRKPLQIVEIDVDYCTRTYGSGLCSAALGVTGQAKCFNTFKTCQDTDNFNKTALTLRFAMNQDGLPVGQTIFPALQSVSTNPTRINIAGVDDDTGALGRRERVTVRLQDFAYHDGLTDKYQSERVSGAAQAGDGYNPQDRGTFFGKLRSRNPFYFGRALRVLNGFVGDELSAMRTQHYIIDEMSGPDVSGAVTFVAKDVLSIADNDKALCPAPSNGKLDRDIEDEDDAIFRITPSAAADAYPSSGKASIGDEIVEFTRTGTLITLTARGENGTDRQSHNELDTFQLAYRTNNALVSEVVSELLTDYAGIDPSYIDQATWDSEVARWLPGLRLRTVIPKPTGVLKLLAELAVHGVSIWWDGVNQKIRFRLNRLVDVTDDVAQISDASNVLEGSVKVVDKPDLRVSQVVFYYDLINFAGAIENPENYRKAEAVVDLEAEGPLEYDQSQYRTFYSRWIDTGSDAAIKDIATRTLLRYRGIPANVTFDLDIKDVGSVDLGDILDLQTRVLQDETGAATPTEMQVMQFEETVPGHRVRVMAQTFAFRGRYGFVTENSRGTYLTATEDQKRLGTYIAPDADGFADATQAYQLY